MAWVRQGNLRGPKGDKGETGADGAKGERGETGARGTRWTHQAGAPTAADAVAGDMSLDDSTGDYYVFEAD